MGNTQTTKTQSVPLTEIEEFLLNLPNPEVPNLENPDDQDDDWIERVKLKQKPWLE